MGAGMPQTNPWKTLSSRIAYSNPWMSVREDEVIRPDGNPGIYGVIETRIATGVVALTPDGEVYLIGQYRYTTDTYSWEVVEGGSDEGETAIDAAKRELQEEAGLVAERWTQLGGEVHISNCISSEVGFIFLAERLTEVPASPDGTELLEVRRMPLRDAIAMADSGEMTDALSIIALYRAERFLAKRVE